MKFASFLQRKSKFTVLALAICCSLLDFVYRIGLMSQGGATLLIGQMFLILMSSMLYALLCYAQFSPNRKLAQLSLFAFLSYFAILRLLNCDDPISYFRDDAPGLLVSYGFFYLLATFVIIAFLVLAVLGTVFPKAKVGKLPMLILSLCYLVLLFAAFWFGAIWEAQNDALWYYYVSLFNGSVFYPALFMAAYFGLKPFPSYDAPAEEKAEQPKTDASSK